MYRLFKFAVAADHPDAQTPYVTPRNSPSSSPANLTFFFTTDVFVDNKMKGFVSSRSRLDFYITEFLKTIWFKTPQNSIVVHKMQLAVNFAAVFVHCN